MSDQNTLVVRLLAIVAAVVLLATACSSDGPDLADVVDDTGSGDVANDGGGDSGAPAVPDDSQSDETAASEESPDMDSTDLPPEALAVTSCADIEAAFASIGGLASGGIGAPPGTDLEADFNQYREGLQSLKSEAPELSADIDAALAGLEVIGAAMAEFDWNVGNLSDPQDAAALAAVMTNSEALGMLDAMTNIATWIAGNCLG